MTFDVFDSILRVLIKLVGTITLQDCKILQETNPVSVLVYTNNTVWIPEIIHYTLSIYFKKFKSVHFL